MVTSTRETFTEMFDNDDTLEYEPAATVAIVLTGQDEEAEDAALEVSTPCQLLCSLTSCCVPLDAAAFGGKRCLMNVQPLFTACRLLCSGIVGVPSRLYQALGLDNSFSPEAPQMAA